MEDPEQLRHVVREVPKAECSRCGQEKPVWMFERADLTPVCKDCRQAEAAERRALLVRRLVPVAVAAVAVVALLVCLAPGFAKRRAYEDSPAYSVKQLAKGVSLNNLLLIKRYYDEDGVRRDLQTALDTYAPTSDEEADKVSDWYPHSFVIALRDNPGTVVSQTATSAVVSYRVTSAEDSSACDVLVLFARQKDDVGVSWKLRSITNAGQVVGSIIGRTPAAP